MNLPSPPPPHHHSHMFLSVPLREIMPLVRVLCNTGALVISGIPPFWGPVKITKRVRYDFPPRSDRERAGRAHHTPRSVRARPLLREGQESRDRPTPSGPTHLCLMSPSTGSSAAPACCRRIRSLILFLAVDLVHPALISSCGSRASLSAVVPRRCTSASSVRSTPHAG